MKQAELTRLLKGERISVLKGKGIIQKDLECGLFLAMIDNKNTIGKSDPFALNLHKNINDAMEEIKTFIKYYKH